MARKNRAIRQWGGFLLISVAIALSAWFWIYKNDVTRQKPQKSETVNYDYESNWYREPVEPEADKQSKHLGEAPLVTIIIDDFGPYGTTKLTREFLALGVDLTWSIIPGNDRSMQIGEIATKGGQEVFIHLPMEPSEQVAMDERDMIMTGMGKEQIHEIFERVSKELPQAVGMNNHMGSKVTRDSSLMKLIAEELKDRDLIFVDSQTAPRSRGYKAMMDKGVPAIKRDVFLDYTPDSSKVRIQYDELIRIARRRGWAIGIGHARRQTLEILKELLPVSIDEGIEFISAGKLVEKINAKQKRKIIDQLIAGDQ